MTHAQLVAICTFCTFLHASLSLWNGRVLIPRLGECPVRHCHCKARLAARCWRCTCGPKHVKRSWRERHGAFAHHR
ncbi:hypothetical protein QBC46DRAFT_393064 [Diplogelasinospora grovesii]|uniref:Secreted protein n=1 Tax=Diplogelasinospora grovesii TaxID=303347 RepID=A0AAN6N2B5_9PEZI|nr:hypothetical protein QBC46DRAFT_393064 [Diplogelasinospora grovesii]